MKKFITVASIALMPTFAQANAPTAAPMPTTPDTEVNQLFNDAEHVYSKFFPNRQQTKKLDPWMFRYYPKTKTYLGVNQNNRDVYLMGGKFGNKPFRVNSFQKVTQLLKPLKNESNARFRLCDTTHLPDGIKYQQNGMVASVSSKGKFIQVKNPFKDFCDINPNTDISGVPINTNLNVLVESKIKSFKLDGLASSTDSSTLKNALPTSMCVVNAPKELLNYTIEKNIQLDITKQYKDTLKIINSVINDNIINLALNYLNRTTKSVDSTNSKPITIQPYPYPNPVNSKPNSKPITIKYTSSSTTTAINDCFSSQAKSIVNTVTKEKWINKNGKFVKINVLK